MRFFAIRIGSGGMESALAICVCLSFCHFEILELSSHLYVMKVAISYIIKTIPETVGSSLRLKGTKTSLLT